MHEHIADTTEEDTVPSALEDPVVTPSIPGEPTVQTGQYPSSMEWPDNGVLFAVREALLVALDRPEHASKEFVWSMEGGILRVRTTVPETGDTLRIEFEEKSGALAVSHTHLRPNGDASAMEGIRYPAGLIERDRMRMAHEASAFVRTRTEKVLRNMQVPRM